MSNTLYPSVLYLQDGTLYKGWSFFKLSSYTGEIVFNTGMTGYQEILSDPSYTGQMVVFTYPEIGNTGLNKQDNESNFIHVKAIISKNISSLSSNWRATISLKDYILKKRIPHIFGLDTRSLARKLRVSGVMGSLLCSISVFNKQVKLNFQSLNELDLIRKITVRSQHNYLISDFYQLIDTKSIYVNPLNKSNVSCNYKIAVLDFGLKFNILRYLMSLGCNICIFPATVNYASIVNYNPDGILLSNGPGNPRLANYAIDIVKKLVTYSNIPLFGICMGHQILNIACGANTFKLKFGHRGLNHPSGFKSYSEITSQNHGFVVSPDINLNSDVLQSLLIKYFNLNDGTIAATFHKQFPIFSVQYHPEASPGPHDADYLFSIFIELINLVNAKK